MGGNRGNPLAVEAGRGSPRDGLRLGLVDVRENTFCETYSMAGRGSPAQCEVKAGGVFFSIYQKLVAQDSVLCYLL